MKFKFVVSASEYGIDPRLDDCELFFNDEKLNKHIEKWFDDEPYAVYEFDGEKFVLLIQPNF